MASTIVLWLEDVSRSERACGQLRSLLPRTGVEAILAASATAMPIPLARWNLARLARRFSDAGVPCREVLLHGAPARAVPDLVREVAAGLVALPVHPGLGFLVPAGCTLTARVLRAVDAPVLAWNPWRHPGAFEFRRILVPIDDTERHGRLLAVVEAVARLHTAEVVLCPGGGIGRGARPELRTLVIEMPLRRLAHAGCAVRRREGATDTAPELRRAVRAEAADLVALAARPPTGRLERWLGTPAERLAGAGLCPVLLQRTDAREPVARPALAAGRGRTPVPMGPAARPGVSRTGSGP